MTGAGLLALAVPGALLAACGAAGVPVTPRAASSGQPAAASPAGSAGAGEAGSGTIISGNHAREGGGAIFFVSNDRTGTLLIKKSTLNDNPNDGFATAGYPGIFFLGQGHPVVISSTIN